MSPQTDEHAFVERHLVGKYVIILSDTFLFFDRNQIVRMYDDQLFPLSHAKLYAQLTYFITFLDDLSYSYVKWLN